MKITLYLCIVIKLPRWKVSCVNRPLCDRRDPFFAYSVVPPVSFRVCVEKSGMRRNLVRQKSTSGVPEPNRKWKAGFVGGMWF